MGAGCCISANLRNNTDMRQNGNSRMEGQARGGRGVINGKPGFGENKLVFDDDICPASCNYGRRSRNNIQVLLAGLILLFTVQSCLYGRSDMNLPHTCRSCKLNFPPPRPLPPRKHKHCTETAVHENMGSRLIGLSIFVEIIFTFQQNVL